MIFSRKALQRLSLLALLASRLSPAVADANAGVGKFDRSKIFLRTLQGNKEAEASAFLLGKPGTNFVLGFPDNADCGTSGLAMVQLDLKSFFQMWKYDASTATIQSIACPDKAITVSSSCNLVQVTAKGSVVENDQKFYFKAVDGFDSDKTAGVVINSNACAGKVLSDGPSSNDGRIGQSITMRGRFSSACFLFWSGVILPRFN